MKPSGTIPTIVLCFTPAAIARLDPLSAFRSTPEPQAGITEQQVLNGPQIAMPPSTNADQSDISTGIIISDVIGKQQDIAIFSGLTRDIDAVSQRLEDATQNATVLAPGNAAMRDLPRKPWEDPKDYDTSGSTAYQGQSGEDRAHANLRRFVEAHIVPESPWEEGKRVKTLQGNEIWYESKDGKKFIKPGDVEVYSITDKVSNGEVWVLKGVINYS